MKHETNTVPADVASALDAVLSFAVENADEDDTIHDRVRIVDAWLNSLKT